MGTDDPLKIAAEGIRRATRQLKAELRLELDQAGREAGEALLEAQRETRDALREAMAEVRAAWAESWSAADHDQRVPSGGVGRWSRAERKEMTRELLLDAAVEVFARKGYHGASLDDVAEAAGFTKGAVYSNFARKSELFQALLEREKSRRDEAMRRALASVPLEFLPAFAAEFFEYHARDLRDRDVLTVELWLAALRDPDVARVLEEGWEAGRAELGASIDEKLRDADVDTGLSGYELAVVFEALAIGLLMDQYLDPARSRSGTFAKAMRKLIAPVEPSNQ